MDHLVVSYSPHLGGAERILLDFAGGLDEPAALACPEGPLARRAREAGMPVLTLSPRRLELRAGARDRMAAPGRIAAHAAELRRLLRSERPRSLVAWNMRSALGAAAALAAERTARPAFVFQHNDLLPGRLVAGAVRAAARRADRVGALSRAIAADLDPRERLGGRLRVVTPGVDLGRFEASAPPVADELLLLGAIVPWKRPELALEAVAIAARRLPDLRLTVAGAPLDAGGERLLERLRERAGRPDLRGRITFSGALDDPRPALARAACLLHCAEREPFGMALVEALAGGRAVVAPASAGPLEIVDGSCGRLYAPGDAAAAAGALAQALADRGRLGAAARERAERLFALPAAQGRFRRLVAEALARRAQAHPGRRASA